MVITLLVAPPLAAGWIMVITQASIQAPPLAVAYTMT
jgi:hypothetical protein